MTILRLAQRISIHAPARGATISFFRATSVVYHFYPRSRKGSDERDFISAIPCIIFLSTLPQGERLPVTAVPLATIPFLSTLPQGERPRHIATCSPIWKISIHAPARGATICISQFYCNPLNFYPRSRKGSDIVSCSARRRGSTFLSTLPQGERRV